MFHKASAAPFQLGSIIKYNTQSRACMHGHTLPGWRAQAGTPNLIYYRSALPAMDSLRRLPLFAIRSARRCLGIKRITVLPERSPPRMPQEGRSDAFVSYPAERSGVPISPQLCFPFQNIHVFVLFFLPLTCSAVLSIKAVCARAH